MEDHIDAFDDLLGTGLEPIDTGADEFGADRFDALLGLEPFDDMPLDVHDVAAPELDAAALDTAALDLPVDDAPPAVPAAEAPAPAADDDPWSAAYLT